MNVAQRIILVASLTLSASAFAQMSIFQQIKNASSIGAIKSNEVEILSNCVDFSGNWHGTCLNRNDVNDHYVDDLKIEQHGCKEFIIDSMKHQLNQTSLLQSTNGYGLLSLKWNDSQTKLTQVMSFAGDNFPFHMALSNWWSLEGDSLVSSTGDYSYGLTLDGTPAEINLAKYDCRYSRK